MHTLATATVTPAARASALSCRTSLGRLLAWPSLPLLPRSELDEELQEANDDTDRQRPPSEEPLDTSPPDVSSQEAP